MTKGDFYILCSALKKARKKIPADSYRIVVQFIINELRDTHPRFNEERFREALK